MYRNLLCAAFVAAAVSAPASAAITVIASNVDFSSAPYTFGVTSGDSFTFTYAPQGSFDPSPVLVNTSGTAQVTTVFGAPSVFFTDPPVTFDAGIFPGFNSVPTPTRASFTLTDSDLGLRYQVGSDYYYGYARFAGSLIETIAFETTANVGIQAGAVPEPASWAMMIAGFGMLGGALRGRRSVALRYA